VRRPASAACVAVAAFMLTATAILAHAAARGLAPFA